ncbi:MAG: DUF86 domain-containing protein [Patescibacteria group bacterium]
MVKADSAYIQDIAQAITKIEHYCRGVNFKTFSEEEMRHDAVVRQLEIVGEATNKLSEDFRKEYPDFPVKEAISMRNFLIHGYNEINLAVVWKTVQEDLPLLKEHVSKLQSL